MFEHKLDDAIDLMLSEGVDAKLNHLVQMILKDPRINGDQNKAQVLITSFVDVADKKSKLILEKYIAWILQQWMRGNVNIGIPWENVPPQDRDRIIETMTEFHDLKRRNLIPAELKDISKKEMNFRKLEGEVEKLTGTRSKRAEAMAQRDEAKKGGSEEIYNDTKYKVVRVEDKPHGFAVVISTKDLAAVSILADKYGSANVVEGYDYNFGGSTIEVGFGTVDEANDAYDELKATLDERGIKLLGQTGQTGHIKEIPFAGGLKAAMTLGQGTSWCTAGYTQAVYYLLKGPLYVCYKDGDKYWQADCNFEEFRNTQDMPLAVCSPAMDWMLAQFVTLEFPIKAKKNITRFRLKCKDYRGRPPITFMGQSVSNSTELERVAINAAKTLAAEGVRGLAANSLLIDDHQEI